MTGTHYVPLAVARVDVGTRVFQQREHIQLPANVPDPRRPPMVRGVVERAPPSAVHRVDRGAVLYQKTRRLGLALLRRHV